MRGRWNIPGGHGLGESSGARAGTPGIWGQRPENSEQEGIWVTGVREIRAVREAEDTFGDFGAKNPRGCPSAEGTGLLPVVWG